jgi:hypothetical protein
VAADDRSQGASQGLLDRPEPSDPAALLATGPSHPNSVAFDLWAVFYLAVVALLAMVGFERRDL